MSDQPHESLNRQELERVAHEVVGRQLKLMVGFSTFLLVLGFVVGQFTGASLARRNTERLQAQLDQVEFNFVALKSQLDEQRNGHGELEAAFVRIESQRRSEIEVDRATLEVLIGNVESTRATVHGDLDEFDTSRRTVPTVQVRRMVDRFAGEQMQSMQQLLTSQARRLGLPDQVKVAVSGDGASTEANESPDSDAAIRERSSQIFSDATATNAAENSREEQSVAESTRQGTTPPVCRPRDPMRAESDAVAAADQDVRYFTAPRRHGLLFISPSQPRRIDPTRMSDSDSIPLPPR